MWTTHDLDDHACASNYKHRENIDLMPLLTKSSTSELIVNKAIKSILHLSFQLELEGKAVVVVKVVG